MQKLIHPRYEVEKTYEATVDSLVNEEQLRKLESGIQIDDYVSAPAKIRLLRSNSEKKTSVLEVTIHEGKNREVRKMFEAIGCRVVRLHRTREAGIELGNLKSGEYRRLKPHELKKLRTLLDRRDA